MSPKVLGQAGTSLADVYDVEGSIAGVENLDSNNVALQHEMGATIFSERLFGSIERIPSGALAQNIAFDVVVSTFPGVYRVLGVVVLVDVLARLTLAQVSLRSSRQGREMPIFVWDTVNDIGSSIRTVENGAASASTGILVQATPQHMPSLGMSQGQPLQAGDEIVFRGLTSGFGAGTVNITALIYVAATGLLADAAGNLVAGLQSRGLPIPGW